MTSETLLSCPTIPCCLRDGKKGGRAPSSARCGGVVRPSSSSCASTEQGPDGDILTSLLLRAIGRRLYWRFWVGPLTGLCVRGRSVRFDIAIRDQLTASSPKRVPFSAGVIHTAGEDAVHAARFLSQLPGRAASGEQSTFESCFCSKRRRRRSFRCLPPLRPSDEAIADPRPPTCGLLSSKS